MYVQTSQPFVHTLTPCIFCVVFLTAILYEFVYLVLRYSTGMALLKTGIIYKNLASALLRQRVSLNQEKTLHFTDSETAKYLCFGENNKKQDV